MSYEITADSWPDFDGWGWDDSWSATDWITWHNAMIEANGEQYANEKVVSAWETIDPVWGLVASDEYIYATDNDAFENHFSQYELHGTTVLNIMIEHVWLGGSLNDLEEFGEDVGEAAGGLIGGITGAVKILPVILILAAVVIGYVFLKKNKVDFNLKPS